MRSKINRDWTPARAKVDSEGTCRNCGGVAVEGGERTLEAAHVLGREHDVNPPLYWPIGAQWGPRTFTVVANRVIPLCGPVGDTRSCHGLDHAGKLDKLKLLTIDEQLQAVADAGGLERARLLLVPRAKRDGVIEIPMCPTHGMHSGSSCPFCNRTVHTVPMREAA